MDLCGAESLNFSKQHPNNPLDLAAEEAAGIVAVEAAAATVVVVGAAAATAVVAAGTAVVVAGTAVVGAGTAVGAAAATAVERPSSLQNLETQCLSDTESRCKPCKHLLQETYQKKSEVFLGKFAMRRENSHSKTI